MSFTSNPTAQEIVRQLNLLIAHHRAAVDVCDAAASRLDDVEQRAEVRHFVSDHLRNIDELSRCVEALGGTATADKADLATSRGDIVGMDRDDGLLLAILADEEKMAEVYDGVGARSKPEGISTAISKASAAVDRHRTWLRQRLQS